MSDSCWFEMVVDKEDVRKVNKIMFDTEDNIYWNEVNENENKTVALVSYEANYGYYTELKRLVEAGITFCGEHSSGSEYGAERFVHYGGEYRSVVTTEDGPVVLVGRDGISEASLKNVQEYYAIYDLVIAIFEA